MKTYLNRLFLAPLFVGALVLGMAGCQQELTDAEHVERAKTFMDEGKLSAGVIELKNALQRNPDNPEARWMLGRAYVAMGDGAAAEKELRRASGLNVALEGILVPLAKAYLLQGKADELLDELPVPASLPAPARAELHRIRAEIYLDRRELDAAEAEIDAIWDGAPGSLNALLGRAALALHKGELEGADQHLAQALELSPSSGLAWSLSADVRNVQGRKTEAIEAYTKAIEYRTRDAKDRFKRAMVHVELEDFEAAMEDANQLRSASASRAAGLLVAGIVHLQEERFGDAQTALEEALNLSPDLILANYHLASAHLAQGHLEQAESYVSSLLAAAPGSRRGNQLLAQIRVQKGDFERAEGTLAQMLRRDPEDSVALNMLASLRVAQGAEPGDVSTRDTEELDPASRMRVGQGLIQAGRLDEGLDELSRALEADPDLHDAIRAKFVAYLRAKRYEEALAEARRLVDELPDDASAHNLLGIALTASGDDEAAIESFDRALALDPKLTNAHLNIAKLHEDAGRLADARRRLERVLEEDQGNVDALRSLASVAEREGNRREAAERLEAAREVAPDNLRVGVPLARIYLSMNQPVRAAGVARSLLEHHPDSSLLIRLLGDASYRAGDWANAIGEYRRLANLTPDSAEVWHRLALAHDRAGNASESVEALDRALELDGGFLPALIGKAEVQLKTEELAAAEETIGAIRAKYPNHWVGLTLLGDLASARDDAAGAASAYREAFELAPSGTLAIRLAEALEGSGARDEAIAVLQEWVSEHPQDATARSRLVPMLAAAGRAEEAEAEREALAALGVSATPESAGGAAMARVTELLRDRRFDEAAAKARDATASRPEDAKAWNLLGAALMGGGDSAGAGAAFERSLALAPGEPTAALNLAQIRAAEGDEAGARRLYRMVLDANPGHVPALLSLARLESASGDMAAAQAWLQKAIDMNPRDPRPRLRLASYFLRLGLAEEALELTRPLSDSGRDDPAVLGVLGEARRQAGDAEGAIDAFRKVTEQRPGSGEAWYRLALAYAAKPDAGDEVRQALEKASRLDPNHRRAGLALARSYDEQGRIEDANAVLEALKAHHPEDPAIEAALQRRAVRAAAERAAAKAAGSDGPSDPAEAINLAAALWVSDEREAAIELLQERVARGAGSPLIHLNLGHYYFASERIGDARQAYEAVLESDPENVNALNNLALLLSTRDAERARALAQRALELSPDSPEVMDTLGTVLLRSNRSEEALRVLTEAASAAPENPSIGFHRAQALDRTGRPDQAREALDRVLGTGAAFPEKNEALSLMRRLVR